MAEIPELAKEEDGLYLPPGFRFHPTDEEIITSYLSEKVADRSFCAVAMGEVDLNECEPWDLPSKAKMGDKEWYFFSQKERRYPTGMRTKRATQSGYWKATGKDKEIHSSSPAIAMTTTGVGNSRRGSLPVLVGMKKTLVFYRGRAPKGEKTNWVMHEFRVEGSDGGKPSKDDWVVVRVFHKNEGGGRKSPLTTADDRHDELLPMTATDQDHDGLNMINYNQVQVLNPNPFFAHPASSYLRHQDQALAMPNPATMINPFIGHHGKGEQFSGSMVSTSRETGLSNDWNAEISSYDDGPSSSAPLYNLEHIWDY